MPESAISALLVVCTQTMFTVRTYALWALSKKILVFMLPFIVFLLASLSLLLSLEPSVYMVGCFPEKQGNYIVLIFGLSLILDLELAVLTAISAFGKYKHARGILVRILIQHNFFYFAFSSSTLKSSHLSTSGVINHALT